MKEDLNGIETLSIKLRNLTFITILGFIILALLIIGLYFTNSSSSTTTDEDATTSDTSYDVSKMNEVDADDVLALFDDGDTHIIFIGRSSCSVCVQLVPELNDVIESTNVTINYLAMDTSSFRTDWEDLFDLFDIETTVNSNEGTYGELLYDYGYTPMVIIIKDGKQVDGFVGYREADTILTLINTYI